MPAAWRIVKAKHAARAFDGEGARLHGGRWTSVGRSAVYTSGTVALATLELLVHLDSAAPLAAYVLFAVAIPEQTVSVLDPISLPRNWRASPAPAALRALGDRWLEESRSAVLRVPSAVVGAVGVEFNYLLNPAHPDFHRITIGPEQAYDLDERLDRVN
ncbi:MAG: RES family NAD+ phosphorylase [Gemmatimonadales bacterium]